MRTPNQLLPVLLTALLLAAGCSSSNGSLTTEPESTAETTEADAQEPATTTATVDPDTTEQGESAETTDDTSTQEGTDADTVSAAVAAADALIATLSEEQVAALSYEYGDSAITTSWSNLPACNTNGRAGIRHGNLSDEQIASVLAVADAVLSDEGFSNYIQIIAADEELGGGDGDVWDADCYYMAFFGTPSATEPWAMQFGGHHYARTVSFADGGVTVTPAFTGVEPRSFTFEGATVEPLAAKSEAIFSIFDTLDDSQLEAARLGSALSEILLGPGSDSFPGSEGLLLSETSAETQAAVMTAVQQWVGDFEDDVADSILASIEADLAATTVSWSTSTDADTQDAYARIDGPTVWIEFINERGVGTSEIHQHSVYRDKTNDYGTAA